MTGPNKKSIFVRVKSCFGDFIEAFLLNALLPLLPIVIILVSSIRGKINVGNAIEGVIKIYIFVLPLTYVARVKGNLARFLLVIFSVICVAFYVSTLGELQDEGPDLLIIIISSVLCIIELIFVAVYEFVLKWKGDYEA